MTVHIENILSFIEFTVFMNLIISIILIYLIIKVIRIDNYRKKQAELMQERFNKRKEK